MSQQVPEVPQEVAEEWALLYEEAKARYDDLAPRRVSKVVLVGIIATAFLILLGGSWGANTYYFQPREATRQAQATVQAIALDTAGQQTAVARDATATYQSLAFDESAQTTRTAQAVEAQATADAQAASAAAQKTAVAATAIKQAEDLRCQDIRRYTLMIAPKPALFPDPGTVHVIGHPEPAVYATWVVTNTGECPWENVKLQPLLASEEAIEPVLRRDGEQVTRVEPGDRVEVKLTFSVWDAGDVDEEWVMRVGDFSLFDQPHLWLKVEQWVISVAPTPTDTPTPTFTPTPTDTPKPPTRKPTKPPKPTNTPKPP